MMTDFEPSELKKLYLPGPGSHKGQNGKLLIIGGSRLFHGASLWALKVASRIVDMVFYSSVMENNELVKRLKAEWWDGMVVPRERVEEYAKEADCVLIGPGMVRQIQNIKQIEEIRDEGGQTYWLTKYLLERFPEKKWVIDAGALQMMEREWLKKLKEVVITPHKQEFRRLFGGYLNLNNKQISKSISNITNKQIIKFLSKLAKKYGCVILLKGREDLVANKSGEVVRVRGGNAGMTKGGSGDVLAGLTASFYCKNEGFLAAKCASYINKKAGESLYDRVGFWFNASDLADEIPKTMAKL